MLIHRERIMTTYDDSEDVYSKRDPGDVLSRHHPSNHYNNTITSTVFIRVTPHYNYFVSWGILYGMFFFTALGAGYQVYLEFRMLHRRKHSGDVDRNLEGVSDADRSRVAFRRILLAALLSRLALIPAQIWSDPLWWQFFGDTFPEMLFASAWTLLVTFFVQTVGVATGTGTNTAPGYVIQATAYCVYFSLVVMDLWNSVASVLLYALLCCIYAALFGTVVYFCPKLMMLLQPSFRNMKGLKIRLSVTSVVSIAIFFAHMIGYARLLIQPPKIIYWWWNYGALELLPAVIFLVAMHPREHRSDRGAVPSFTGSGSGSNTPISGRKYHALGHSDSLNSPGNNSRKGESSPLTRAGGSYGTLQV